MTTLNALYSYSLYSLCVIFLQIKTKKRVKLSKCFKCPFCANEDTVECKMDNKAGIGSLACRLCGAAYQMPIHHLHEAVDVFSEWLDDCEAAANPAANRAGDEDGGAGGGGAGVPRYQDDDDDDDIPESSGLGDSRKKSAGGNSQRQDHSTSLGLDDSDDDDED
jgi:transcription elongation factor Elf1